jgi:hypothetical protein
MVKIGDLVITYHTPLPPAPCLLTQLIIQAIGRQAPPLAGRTTRNGVMRVWSTRITPFLDSISLKSDDNPC